MSEEQVSNDGVWWTQQRPVYVAYAQWPDLFVTDLCLSLRVWVHLSIASDGTAE